MIGVLIVVLFLAGIVTITPLDAVRYPWGQRIGFGLMALAVVLGVLFVPTATQHG